MRACSRRPLVPAVLALLAAACGGSPTGPDSSPTPVATSSVSGFVFYDENGNGVADASETVRLPNVTVRIGSVTVSTAAGGRLSFSAVPNGTQTVQADLGSLPAYFTPGPPQTVPVPAAGEIAVPVQLPLSGSARSNVYMAFGDSITVGEHSSDGTGYLSYLQADLRAYWGKASVLNQGASGTKSNKGESRMSGSLDAVKPAYALILYGTNDFNAAECKSEFPCYTIDALRSMILQTRDKGAVPVLGTIPPVNPAYVDKFAEERNDWVTRMNVLVRAMAAQERVAVAEVHGDFRKQPSLTALFADEVHPNDAGYRILSRSFFDAITKPIGATTSRRSRSFAFGFPGGS